MIIEFDPSEVERVAKALALAPAQAHQACLVAAEVTSEAMLHGAMGSAPRGRPWLATDGYRSKAWSDDRGVHADVVSVEDDRGVNVGFEVEFGNSETPPNPVLSHQLAWGGPAFAAAIAAGVDPL